MSYTRRTFLAQSGRTGLTGLTAAGLLAPRRSAAAAAAAISPPVTWPTRPVRPLVMPPPDERAALAARALEAAKAAGASYADVRLVYERVYRGGDPAQEYLTVGVRAVVKGYWGFAGGTVWTPDAVAFTARTAAGQAKIAALAGPPRELTLAPAPVVRDGFWASPRAIDPLAIHPDELADWIAAFATRLGEVAAAWRPTGPLPPGTIPPAVASPALTFRLKEATCATSDGATWAQATCISRITVNVISAGQLIVLGDVGQGGWEFVTRTGEQILRELPQVLEALVADVKLPRKPVEVGKYDAVFDWQSMAALLGKTLGGATQLDRTLGFEANADGTSYLGPDPLEFLGTPIAAPLVTVTADRSAPGHLATTRWDDEGVVPEDFPLVKAGVLTDYQTTREMASYLTDYYAKAKQPVRSRGCAASPTALDAPLVHPPNLTLAPGAQEQDFDDLVAALGKGVAFRGSCVPQDVITLPPVDTDFQFASGLGRGVAYEVRGGRRVAVLVNAGYLFDTPEFWKSIQALGGPKSRGWSSQGMSTKGEPPQSVQYTLGAVPAVLKQLTVIDALRKA